MNSTQLLVLLTDGDAISPCNPFFKRASGGVAKAANFQFYPVLTGFSPFKLFFRADFHWFDCSFPVSGHFFDTFSLFHEMGRRGRS